MIAFKVPGTPIPQGSKRIGRANGRKDGKPILIDDNDVKLSAWRREVARAASHAGAGKKRCEITRTLGGKRVKDWVVFDGPVVVFARFVMPRPKSRSDGELHTVKPDLDKLQRAVGDALTDAGIVKDDCQIVGWPAVPAKVYGDEPRLDVAVQKWEG